MKRWYVAQVFSGFEEQIKDDILRRVEHEGLTDEVSQVLIPSAKLKSLIPSAEAIDQQLFPGYILIEAELTDPVKRLVSATPRLMRFLGGREPLPLSPGEIDRILARVKGEVIEVEQEAEFTAGSEVEIMEGAFAGFVGIIEEVNMEAKRLKVMVSILGRMTPVELNFDQVK